MFFFSGVEMLFSGKEMVFEHWTLNIEFFKLFLHMLFKSEII